MSISIFFQHLFSTIVMFCCVLVPLHVMAGTPLNSLFGYKGLNMIPTAYISEGELTLNYTHLPRSVAFHTFDGGRGIRSDNDIYSVTIGMFPFLEGYMSLTVEPQLNMNHVIDNHGAKKSRSIGGKLQFFSETLHRPAVALCIFDPNLKKLGASKAANNISSTCLVASKSHGRIGMTVGYGDDQFAGVLSRLNGWFGGTRYAFGSHVSVMIDYDTEYLSEGIQISWHGFEAQGCIVDGNSFAFHFGYGMDLLPDTKSQ